MRYPKFLTCLLALLLFTGNLSFGQKTINLSGVWKFAIDPGDKGIAGKWFSHELKDQVSLPGSMSTNGKGDEITANTKWTGQILDSSYFKNPEYAKYREHGNIKIPFWLQPLKHYQGAAWYQKEVIIPENWKGQNIRLYLERCHWESRIWIDNQETGMRNSLGTPHIYDLTGCLSPGKHTLTVCVDNRTKEIDPGVNSHSISDHTQTNWNGIVGQLFLEARAVVNIGNIQVYPDIQNKRIIAKITVKNPTGKAVRVKIVLNISGATHPADQSAYFDLTAGDNNLTMDYPMGSEVKLWNEFHPAMYHLRRCFNQYGDQSDRYRPNYFWDA